MIRSVGNAARNMGWRHPRQFTSLHDVIYACNAVDDGALLFGSVLNLDSSAINNGYYKPCTKLKYGMMLTDWSYEDTTLAGCGNLPFGHSSGIVGGAVPPSQRQENCLASFGVGGSGYYRLDNTQDSYAINAHYWGAANDNTWNWNSHAIFVRRKP
eukprot:TRINITY_DN11464_c0_g1_i1.p3 TRINITY_DN11464_c0_g1~~TRINITY_DN11464_c0_g1_i1.p3  ORF type:complete len:156 (+),score=35.98 TRINITY_DN11464_c0_g1_i1:666-1133(+)